MSSGAGCNPVWPEDGKRLIDLEREKPALERVLADAELEKIARAESRMEHLGAGTPAGSRSSPAARAGVGEQSVCRVIGHCCATQRRELPRAPCMIRMRRCGPGCAATGRPQRGVRAAYHNVRAEGWAVNHDQSQCLWREEVLHVPQYRRPRGRGSSTAPPTVIADTQSGVGGGISACCHHRRRPIKSSRSSMSILAGAAVRRGIRIGLQGNGRPVIGSGRATATGCRRTFVLLPACRWPWNNSVPEPVLHDVAAAAASKTGPKTGVA